MRRNRQFRPELDSLMTRILPSDMLQYINAIQTFPTTPPPAKTITPTRFDIVDGYPVYYPGAGNASDDPTFCVLKPPAPPTVTPTASSPATPPATPQPASPGR